MKVSGGIKIDIAAADGFTVSLSKYAHSYGVTADGTLKENLDTGLIKVSVKNGKTQLICPSTTTTQPSINGTYKVTSIVMGSGMTISKSISGNQFVFWPASYTAAGQVTMNLTIVAMWEGVDYTFTQEVTFSKTSDGREGANYLYMGWWVQPDPEDTSKPYYRITDMGIPMVKVADGTAPGYSVWVLQVAVSNNIKPSPTNPQWKLVESTDFIYIQQAYIERLQAELISAVTVELKEDTSSYVTAGLSGIQGAAKDQPAFWAGGTYDEAISNTAKAIIRHNGRVKFTDAEITGNITVVSENGRLVIDGRHNTIYLLDDSGSIKTVIRPGDISTSVSSYFSGSLNQDVSFSGIKGAVTGTTTKNSSTIFLSAGAYEATIPSITLTASTTYNGGVGSSILSLKLVLSNGISSNDILIAEALALSTGGEGYEQVVIPQTKKMITKSGTWRLRLISTAESIGGGTATNNGSLTSDSSLFNISEIVNRSEIGSNGMMIATSIDNYNYMVGDTFEVRRGNSGLQITNSGIKKWNGTSWVTANI